MRSIKQIKTFFTRHAFKHYISDFTSNSCRLATSGCLEQKVDKEEKKSYANLVKCVDTVSAEVQTLKLTLLPSNPMKRLKKVSQIPKEAKAGLRAVLSSAALSAKELQKSADDLYRSLADRKIPADRKTFRNAEIIVKKRMKKSDQMSEMNMKYGGTDEAMTAAVNYKEKKQIAKLLKQQHYNWKPLALNDTKKALIYSLATFAQCFAATRTTLQEFDRSQFTPYSVLDYGSGCGTTFWACEDTWPNVVDEYCLVDISCDMNRMAMDIIRGGSESGELMHKNVNFSRTLPPDDRMFDLVVSAYSMIEINNQDNRFNIATELWKRTKRFLVLIESGRQDSFETIIAARDYILTSGWQLVKDQTVQTLSQHNLMNDQMYDYLTRQGISEYERYQLLRSKVPDNIHLPTLLPSGHVYAPCPHDMICPQAVMNKSCARSVRWQSIRSAGKAKSSDGTETDTVSYVIIEKACRPVAVHTPPSRLINQKLARTGHLKCTLCTPYCGVKDLVVSRKFGPIFKCFRQAANNSLLPVDVQISKYDDLDNEEKEYREFDEDDEYDKFQ